MLRRSLLASAALLLARPALAEAKTLKVVMHSDLKILDPIWTTAYIVRNHGYMIYDTLLALDARLAIQPQMLDSWKVSDDKLTYTFTLRDGLKFHDGAPVTAEDCVASLKRWGARDAMGQKLMQFTKELAVFDPKTFTLTLKEPYGMVLESLAKPSSSVPFIMPKRIAETPADKQITEFVGSGPFVFKKELWRPGDRVVYEKFADYKPRSEPPSGLAGGKRVYVDRVEWVVLPDSQTAVNALLAGEIDMMQQPPFDMLPLLESSKGIKVVDLNTLGTHFAFRFNTLHKPFDDPRIIAGQGTMGLEIAEDLRALGLAADVVSAPASGGGLMAGIALAIHHHFPQAKLFTAEPDGYDDHARSFASGQRQRHHAQNRTFCDALMAPEPGELTFAINRKLVAGGVTASDAEVTQAMAFAFRELKLVAEPGGSVALAALLAGRIEARGKTVVIVLSGGNVDAGLYADAIREGAV